MISTRLFVLTVFLLTAGCTEKAVEYIASKTSQPGVEKHADGRSVFFNRARGGCSVCHKINDKKLVGPGLAGTSRLHTDEWLRKWLKDPRKVWEENDPETQAMKKRLGREKRKKSAMKLTRSLSDSDIEALIEYLKTL